MLIEDFNEFVKSLEDESSEDHVSVTEQEEETEDSPEELDITNIICGLPPSDFERELWVEDIQEGGSNAL